MKVNYWFFIKFCWRYVNDKEKLNEKKNGEKFTKEKRLQFFEYDFLSFIKIYSFYVYPRISHSIWPFNFWQFYKIAKKMASSGCRIYQWRSIITFLYLKKYIYIVERERERKREYMLCEQNVVCSMIGSLHRMIWLCCLVFIQSIYGFIYCLSYHLSPL